MSLLPVIRHTIGSRARSVLIVWRWINIVIPASQNRSRPLTLPASEPRVFLNFFLSCIVCVFPKVCSSSLTKVYTFFYPDLFSTNALSIKHSGSIDRGLEFLRGFSLFFRESSDKTSGRERERERSSARIIWSSSAMSDVSWTNNSPRCVRRNLASRYVRWKIFHDFFIV